MVSQPLNESAREAELTSLRERVDELERENALLADQIAAGPRVLGTLHKELLLNVAQLRKQVEELEAENRHFADMYIRAQEQNGAIMALYVASQRLHATLDPDEVMKIVSEILIEMVGAEDFGVFLVDDRRQELQLIADEGASHYLQEDAARLGPGVLGKIVREGEAFFLADDAPREGETPLAAIPIKIEGHTLGVLAIYKLLGHKGAFSDVDHQILDLLGAHAATALMSARLHKTMNRKLKTIEGFMDLLKK